MRYVRRACARAKEKGLRQSVFFRPILSVRGRKEKDRAGTKEGKAARRGPEARCAKRKIRGVFARGRMQRSLRTLCRGATEKPISGAPESNCHAAGQICPYG